MKRVIALALLASAALVFTATTSAKHHHPKPPGIVGGGIGLVAPAVNKHGIAPASPEPQTTCNDSGDCATSGCKSPASKPKPKSSCSPKAPPRSPATNGNGRAESG